MAIQLGDAVIRITGDLNEFNSSLKTAQKNAQSSFGAIAQGARQIGIAMAAVGAASIAGLGGAVKMAATFEKAIITAAAVTGKSGQEYDIAKEKLSALAKELGRTTVFSAKQAANAFVELGRMGIDVASLSIKELLPLMDLASGQNISLSESSQLVVSTLKQYNFGFEESARVADVFTVAANNSNTTMAKLAGALPIVGSLAAESGVQFEELVASLGILFDRGIEASTAATGLRRTISSLFNPTSQAIEVYERLGVTWDEINPATNKLSDVMKTLGDSGMTAGDAFKIFGQRAANTVIVLSGANDKFGVLKEKIDDASGSAEELRKKQMEGLTEKIKILKSQLEGLAIAVGEKLVPALTDLTEKISPILASMIDWIDKHPTLTKVITGTVAAISALLIVLGSFLIAASLVLVPLASLSQMGVEITAILGGLKAVIGAIAGAFTLAGVALAAAAAVAVAAWVWAGVAIKKEWENVKKFFSDIWNGIKDLFRAGTEIMEGDFESFTQRLKDMALSILATWQALPAEIARGLGLAGLFGIEEFASGGIMHKSGLAIVGEQGPELVHLPGGARVDNAQSTAAQLGTNITAPLINIQNVNASSEADVDAFMLRAGRVVRGALLDSGITVGAMA
jgi:TP901 family phage tail tape measure protein